MRPILSLLSVGFVRNRITILDEISWTVNPGEHWAVLGANGSGKTTLLKIVTGYEWATTGSIEVLGERLGQTDVRALRRHVGWVSSSLEHRVPTEDCAADVVLSGLEASLGLYRPFNREERDRAQLALETVGGAALALKQYGVLSQGEQQRVLIARALIARPSLLLLDEPCTGLDPSARHRFLHDVHLLSGTDTAPALVLVTHHIEEIGPWVNRVLVLKKGKVLAQGETNGILVRNVLSEAFDMSCQVRIVDGIFRLELRE